MSKPNPRSPNIHAAVYLLLIQDSKLLMLKRANTGYMDGYYSLVAGHMDGGEGVVETLLREAEEEAGIQLDPDHCTVSVTTHRMSDREYIDFYVFTDTYVGEITNKEPHKCEELAWFRLDDLPENTVLHVREAVEAHLKGECFKQF